MWDPLLNKASYYYLSSLFAIRRVTHTARADKPRLPSARPSRSIHVCSQSGRIQRGMLARARKGVSKLHGKLKAACNKARLPPEAFAVGHSSSGQHIEPPKLCGMEADTAVRVAKAGKLIGWMTSLVPGLGNIGKAIRAAAGAGQQYAEQQIELAAESKSTLEILVNLNRFLSVLMLVCSELRDDELQNLGVSSAAERIQSLCEEFTEAMVESYGGGDRDAKATMAAMFFALVDADAAIGEESEEGEEAEEEEAESAVPAVDLKFLEVVKDKSQRCMAEITFCVAASQSVLQQKQSSVMRQEMTVVMQQLDQLVGLQQKLQAGGEGSVKAAVEAVRVQLLREHQLNTGQILQNLRQGFSQVLAGQEQAARERQRAERAQMERDDALKAEMQNLKLIVEEVFQGNQAKGQQTPAQLSGAATAPGPGRHASVRTQQLIQRLHMLPVSKTGSQDPGVKKSRERLGGGGQS
eukprot:664513-Rhodomonas_salina.3